jgi:hypothetical protein
MHTSKQLLHTGKLVKNPKLHMLVHCLFLALWLKLSARILAHMISEIKRWTTNEKQSGGFIVLYVGAVPAFDEDGS